MNEISRTRSVQGFECTKAAVLSHRSGCLLRTVVPIETDFFSERLCVVMSRLPWRVSFNISLNMRFTTNVLLLMVLEFLEQLMLQVSYPTLSDGFDTSKQSPDF